MTPEHPTSPAGALRLGVTFHSFNAEYISYVWSFEDLMINAVGLGGGVELVGPVHHRSFPHVPAEFEAAFRSSCERHGLIPTCYGSYADPFLLWDRRLSNDELVDYTLPQIAGAARLGFSTVRLQHFAAPIVERVLPLAERLDIKLGYELHVPLDLESARTHELVEQIHRIDSPHLGLIPDAGIFARSISESQLRLGVQAGLERGVVDEVAALWNENRGLEEADELVSRHNAGPEAHEWTHRIWGRYGHSDPADLHDVIEHVIHVHAKFFAMEDGAEPDLRYPELVRALVELDYTGWISSEYEGPPADSYSLVAEQQAMIRRCERQVRGG